MTEEELQRIEAFPFKEYGISREMAAIARKTAIEVRRLKNELGATQEELGAEQLTSAAARAEVGRLEEEIVERSRALMHERDAAYLVADDLAEALKGAMHYVYHNPLATVTRSDGEAALASYAKMKQGGGKDAATEGHAADTEKEQP